uniref:TPR_REGION domain-containing protein n=1 Tax=Parastrongyloides trichosuri TaxID=131310 RepID=A0A0N4ZUS5_PARTI
MFDYSKIKNIFSLFENVDSLEDVEKSIKTFQGMEDDLLYLGKSCIDGYLAMNYAGHQTLLTNLTNELSNCSFLFNEQVKSVIEKKLSFNLNKPYSNARGIVLLYIAKIAYDSIKTLKKDLTFLHSKYQLLFLWVSLLEEPELSLKEDADDIFDDIQGVLSKLCSGGNDSMSAELKSTVIAILLCSFYFNMKFYNYTESEKVLKRAMELCCFNIEFDGALGKRTKFQQNYIAQLVANSNLDEKTFDDSYYWTKNISDLPIDVSLNDDTILETINFEKKREEKELSPLQCASIMAFAYYERRTQFRDELMNEKLNALYNKVLCSKNSWAISCTVLMERSLLEKKSSRRVERACSQAEVIAKLMDGVDDKMNDDDKMDRVKAVIVSGMPPFWKIKISHAEILVSLGCVSEALMIYELLNAWDNVIDCYKMLKQIEKAETLVRNLLKEKEDPIYYCYLGDITLQSSYYEKAIEVSGDKSARAQKSLGELLINRNEYESAYNHLKRSVQLQPIQLGVWFNLGHCAWKLTNYKEATNAYHRCVSLEPEHYQAWNNLSAAYIRLGQKPRAQKILEEALKFCFDDVKMWENYLFVCVDNGDFKSAVKAYHRILEVGEGKKIADNECLEILCKEVNKLPENDNVRTELLKLMARITAKTSVSASVWRAYAILKKPSDEVIKKGDQQAITSYSTYVKLLERCILANKIQGKELLEDVEQCINILSDQISIHEAKITFAKLSKDLNTDRVKAQADFDLENCIRKILKVHGKLNGCKFNDSDDENENVFDEKQKTKLSEMIYFASKLID